MNEITATLTAIGSGLFLWATNLLKKYAISIVEHTAIVKKSLEDHETKMDALERGLQSSKDSSKLASDKFESQIEQVRSDLKFTRTAIEARTDQLEQSLKFVISVRGEIMDIREAIESLNKRVNNQTSSMAVIAKILEEHKEKLK